jgi:riboflavin kinase/FMN adenylyltransferase
MSPLACVDAGLWRPSADEPRLVCGVGNFDGVHRGHQRILDRIVHLATEHAWRPAILTFDPHPLKVLRPENPPRLLTTLEQRLALFAAAGISLVLLQKFDLDFARLSPEEFVERILIERLQLAAVVVGANFRFGHRQQGDAATLGELGSRRGLLVEIVPAVLVRGTPVSSTRIREAIAQGRVTLAGRLLGRPFAVTGRVEPGAGRGARLLVPTLNVRPEQELLPRHGVYATETLLGDRLYRSVTNVGVRPTFDGQRLTVETHLFGFDGSVAADRIEVRFWKWLREERRFDSLTALREQIARDIERARRFFVRLDRWRQRPAASPVQSVQTAKK